MKRLWPFALLVLPALALVGRVESTATPPRITRLPSGADVLETPETPAQAIERHFLPPTDPDPAPPVEAAPEPPPGVVDDSVQDPDAWKRSPITSSIVWFSHHQNADGSFGDGPATLEGHPIDRAGVTALAVLSCLGHGYSPLSKDDWDGMNLGTMVRDAVKWLVADQREDGSFRSVRANGFDQALAALALSEAYGTTATAVYKGPTEKAIEALIRMQGTDGSWGGPAPTAWSLLAIKSAELSELPVEKEPRTRALRYGETTSHPADLWNRIVFERNRQGAEGMAAVLACSPPGAGDFAGSYHTLCSLFQFDGPAGPVWKSSSGMIRQTVLSQHTTAEAWFGSSVSDTVVKSSLAMLTLQLFYRSGANVFSEAH